MERVFESSKNSETEQIDAVRKYWEHEKFLNMLNASDPFVGRNALGVRYSETPCWPKTSSTISLLDNLQNT